MISLDSLRFCLWRLRGTMSNAVFGKKYRRKVFERIYAGNAWSDPESVSGGGSNLKATERIRHALPLLWAEHGVRSLLDAPCGDFAWMKTIVDRLESYIGIDIVPALIERNTGQYGSSRVRFMVADMTTDPLPRCDMILCRDAMIHLPTALILRALRQFRTSGAKHLLMTTVPGARYKDVPVGSFRPIDFEAPPFSLPRPEWTLVESEPNRLLAMWRLDQLPD